MFKLILHIAFRKDFLQSMFPLVRVGPVETYYHYYYSPAVQEATFGK